MPELLVLRHAKSDWNATFSSDHERPLNRRGRRAALQIGEFLARSARLPEQVLCSTATRTRETLEILLRAANCEPEIEFSKDLYGAGVPEWLATVQRGVTADCTRLLVVGHEPTCSGVVQTLSGATVRFPTAGLACLQVSDFANLPDQDRPAYLPAKATLLWFLIPRLLDGSGAGAR